MQSLGWDSGKKKIHCQISAQKEETRETLHFLSSSISVKNKTK